MPHQFQRERFEGTGPWCYAWPDQRVGTTRGRTRRGSSFKAHLAPSFRHLGQDELIAGVPESRRRLLFAITKHITTRLVNPHGERSKIAVTGNNAETIIAARM